MKSDIEFLTKKRRKRYPVIKTGMVVSSELYYSHILKNILKDLTEESAILNGMITHSYQKRKKMHTIYACLLHFHEKVERRNSMMPREVG